MEQAAQQAEGRGAAYEMQSQRDLEANTGLSGLGWMITRSSGNQVLLLFHEIIQVMEGATEGDRRDYLLLIMSNLTVLGEAYTARSPSL